MSYIFGPPPPCCYPIYATYQYYRHVLENPSVCDIVYGWSLAPVVSTSNYAMVTQVERVNNPMIGSNFPERIGNSIVVVVAVAVVPVFPL